MNEDDKQIGTDNYQPDTKFPKDGLGFLKIDHPDWKMPETPEAFSAPVIKAAKPKAKATPVVVVPEVKEEAPVAEIEEEPIEQPEIVEAIDSIDPIDEIEPTEPTATTEIAEPTELTEPTLPVQMENILLENIEALPEVVAVAPKKNKKRAIMLAAASLVLMVSVGFSSWWLVGGKDTIANRGDDSSLVAVNESENNTDATKDDNAAQSTAEEQKPETAEETISQPSANETTNTPAQPVPPAPAVIKPTPPAPVVVKPAEPTPPAPQFERGTMTLSTTRDSIYWNYTGKAIYGYKLVYNKQTVTPTVEKHPYLSFDSMHETSLSLPTDRLPKDVYIVRVCAYTANTSGDICVDYSNYAILRNY